MPDSENDSTTPSLLILGASTRAAAHSAIRAGLAPVCADLFADCDLRDCAEVLEVADYPFGLVAAARGAPPGPWMYTGGIENHPALVSRISQSRLLWGNRPDVLRRARDPWSIQRLLLDAGLPVLRIWPRQATPPAIDGQWMLKPVRGAAGRGIRSWDHHAITSAALHERHYFQECVVGISVSAVFIAFPQETILLGITRQLVGMPEVHAPPFAWCGTITPINLPPPIIATMNAVGRHLGSVLGLSGLFGCDFLVDRETAWLTEVNPRYPAAAELVESSQQIPILDWHRRACEGFLDSSRRFAPPAGDLVKALPRGVAKSVARPVVGKIVLYAQRDLKAPNATRFVCRPSSGQVAASLPYMADIPLPGQLISRGQPICTLFARAPSESECLARLLRRAARFERRIK